MLGDEGAIAEGRTHRSVGEVRGAGNGGARRCGWIKLHHISRAGRMPTPVFLIAQGLAFVFTERARDAVRRRRGT